MDNIVELASSKVSSKYEYDNCYQNQNHDEEEYKLDNAEEIGCDLLEKDIDVICSFATAAALQMIRRKSYVPRRNRSKLGDVKRFFCCVSAEEVLRPLDEESHAKLRASFSQGESVKDNPLIIRSRSSTGRKMSVSEECEVDRAIVYETLKSYSLKKVLEEMFGDDDG